MERRMESCGHWNQTSPPRPLAEYREYMSVRDVADHADVCETTVRRWLNDRLLIGWKLPGRKGEWRIRRSSYEHFIAQHLNTYNGNLK